MVGIGKPDLVIGLSQLVNQTLLTVLCRHALLDSCFPLVAFGCVGMTRNIGERYESSSLLLLALHNSSAILLMVGVLGTD